MQRDSGRQFVVEELLVVRRQTGPFETRLANSTGLISLIGGGNLRYAREHLEKIRRAHVHEPDGDISTYFASAGYRTAGATLEKRLETLAKRHHVSEKTVLRRSDRGAVAIAQLIRHQMRYERPWGFFFAFQEGPRLSVRVTFSVDPDDAYRAPFFYLAGDQIEVDERVSIEADTGYEQHVHTMDPIALDLDGAEDPLVELLVAWVPTATPIWNVATHLDDARFYARVTFDALMPNLQFRIHRWEDF